MVENFLFIHKQHFLKKIEDKISPSRQKVVNT